MRARVTGDRDPGYGTTSKMLGESALCLAFAALSSPGGVLTLGDPSRLVPVHRIEQVVHERVKEARAVAVEQADDPLGPRPAWS